MLDGIHLGAALLLLLVALLVPWRWRREAERKEKVRRLILLAAAEEDLAEKEASVVFSVPAAPNNAAAAPWAAAAAATATATATVAKAPPPHSPPECASCSSPATGRCARCKAVRYCSVKCQIIHWRQGHKDQCHPPSYNVENAVEFDDPGSNEGESKRSGLSENNAAPENLLNVKLAENLPQASAASTSPDPLVKDNAPSDKTSRDDSWKEKDSDTGIDASIHEGTMPSLTAAAPDTFASEEPLVPEDAGRGESSAAISSNNGGITVQTSDDKSTKCPIPVVGTGVSEENTLPPSQLKYNASLSHTETVEQSSSTTNIASSMLVDHTNQQSETAGESLIPDHITSKVQGPIADISSDFEAKMSSGCTLPESKSQMEHTEKLVFYTSNSSPAATRSMSDMSLQNKKISGSPACGSNQLSSNDGCPSAFHKVSQAMSVSIRSTNSMDNSGHNNLPVSTNGIVTKLPASKISRNYPSEFVLFPYDLFIKLYNDKVEFHPCGLINSGNSCYANVVLQCLSFTRPLTTYFFEGLHSRTCSKKEWCFTCELEKLFMNSKQGKSPLSTMGILSHLKDINSIFGQGKQEDAHEFLRYAIDAMQSVCLKKTGAKPGEPLAEETTLIQQTYGGYLRSKIICCRCKGESERFERMMDLAVEIDGDINSIEEALHRFASPEILDGENKYKCDRCKSYERAEKQLTISEAPNVLTITLKRFQCGQFGKLNKVVRFHEFLDLAPYMCNTDDETPIYRLYAVVVHIDVMNASSSGHYICYVKDTREKWYEINDSKVKPVEFQKVLARNAYILFYARCLPRAPSLIRNAMAYELTKINRKWKSKSQHSPSVDSSQHHLPRRNADDPANYRSFLFEERESDSSSLFSCSDEGSCSTDSTKESTASDESLEHASISPLRSSPDSDAKTGSSSWRHSSDRDTVDNALVSDSSRSFESFFITSSSGQGDDKSESGRKSYIKSQDTPEAGNEAKGSLPVSLYPDKSKGFRHLTENYRSRETDWIKTREAESGVVLRRPSRERSAQAFY